MTLAYFLLPPPDDGQTSGRRSEGSWVPPRVPRPRLRRGEAEHERLGRLQSGDPVAAGAAFDEAIREYYAVLCASVESYLGDRAAAEEVTDAVFERVWERRTALVVRTTLAAYLFGAVRNAALNALAKRRFADRRGAEAVAAAEPPGMGRSPARPDQLVEEAELRALVWNAVATLPERARAILTLRWRMQLEWPEVADAMRMTANAVQVQHSRALKALRDRLPELSALL